MERSQQANDMIFTMDTQSTKTPDRLYPSLPKLDGCVDDELGHAVQKQLKADAVDYPHRPREDTQPEMSDTDGVDTMKEQVALLEKQRRELIAINKKWAEQYESMTRSYKEKVQKLKTLQVQHGPCQTEGATREAEERPSVETDVSQIKDRKESPQVQKLKTLQVQHGPCQTEGATREAEERPSVETDVSQIKDRKESPQMLEAEQEAERLRAQNCSLSRRGQRQHKEIQRLNKALEEALQTTAHVEDISPDRREEIWKHQAQVYKEDFLKERRDREKLKEKQLQLEQRFSKVHLELHTLKSQVTWTPTLPRLAPECTCTPGAHTPPRADKTHPRAHTDTQHH